MDAPYTGPDAAPPGAPRPAAAARDTAAEIDELRRRVEQNDDEIDALQIAAARGEERAARPFYREPGIVIAVMALLFSFGTTVVSYARLDQDRQHEARNELTGYMQRLGELPRLAAQVRLQYGDVGASDLLGFVNAETGLIANQARSAIQVIPNQVSTLEYVTVGYAFQSTGEFAQAEELYQHASDLARESLDRVVALRSLAAIKYLLGDVTAGRDLFSKARGVYADEAGAPAIVVSSTDTQTELLWANAELTAGFCAEATAHADAAESLTVAQPAQNFAALIAQLRANIGRCGQPGGPVNPQPTP